MDTFVIILKTLCILVPPMTVNGFIVPTNVTVVEGSPVILPCSVGGGDNQDSSTVLVYTDEIITDDPRISLEKPRDTDRNLHINGTVYNDRGKYSCNSFTCGPGLARIVTFMLTVSVPVKIIIETSSTDQTAQEGDSVTLACNVTGDPKPDVTWYKLPDESTHNKEQIGSYGEVLIIHNVSRSYEGTYECAADNNVSAPVSRRFMLSVEFAAMVWLPSKRKGRYVGRETVLQCEITAHPHAVAYWMKGENAISSFDHEKYQTDVNRIPNGNGIILSLRIIDIQPEDFGEYTCYASNQYGQDQESLLLYDRSPRTENKSTTKEPVLIETTSLVSISQKGDENMTASVAALHHVTMPSILYVWSLFLL